MILELPMKQSFWQALLVLLTGLVERFDQLLVFSSVIAFIAVVIYTYFLNRYWV